MRHHPLRHLPWLSSLTLLCGGALLSRSAGAQPEPSPDEEDTAAGEEVDEITVGDDEEKVDDEGGDEATDEEDLAPNRSAPPGKGVVWGTLTDAKTGEPLIDVQVKVVGKAIQAFSNYDGQYRLEVPPGVYDLELWIESHRPIELQGVRVGLGRLVQTDEKMEPLGALAEETFAVEEEADVGSVEGQLLTRKRSAAVGDSVGRKEISKTPDRNAAEAAKRVPGASIVGGRFVFVRGLGERYVNALLDGAPLPSPEPDRQTVPLDLFPTLMVENITIAKTFTPDVPGDFAGGSVRIATRRLPEKFTFSVGLSGGLNTESTFRDGLAYRGGDLDWLGIDDGDRRLPSDLPDYKVCRGCQHPDGEFFTNEELAAHGRSVNSYMSTIRRTVPPDHGGRVVVGNSWTLSGDQRLGVMGALTYGRTFEQRRGEIIRTFGLNQAEGGLRLLNDLEVERGIDKVRWGGLAGITYELNRDNRFHLTGLYSRSSDNEAVELEGHHDERSAIIHDTRLSFIARSLLSGQVRGEHQIDALAGAQADWTFFLSRAERAEPNTRGVVFQFDSGSATRPPGYAFEDDSLSAMHFYADQGETTVGGGFDWTQPLATFDDAPKLKMGSLFSLRSRTFDSRRFRFRPDGPEATPARQYCAAEQWDPTCPDQLFPQTAIGSVWVIDENTRPNDAYAADLDVISGYLMADAKLAPQLRAIAGERIEVSSQSISSFDPLDPTADRVESSLDDISLLPAVALVYSATESLNLRIAGSRTLARPQLREVAPFAFTDFFGGREVQGNPDLELTRILNTDVRLEWFPTVREVVAGSVFFKHFEDPIEEVIKAGGSQGISTFENAASANLMGIELEGRKSLDFLTAVLKDLSVLSNVTFAFSKIELDPETTAFVTNRDRPLANQAPYIINAALDYTNDDIGLSTRLLYNVAGPTIVRVGKNGLPDVYQQPRHQLDFTASQQILEGLEASFTAKNLTNDDVRWTQGDEDTDQTVTRSYTTGISFGLSASYTY